MPRKPSDAGLAPARKTRSARRGARTAPRAAPEIDMGGLDQVIGYAIRRAQAAVFQDYSDIAADLGITTTQFAVLRVVLHNPGLSQVMLASVLGADAPRMVLIIDELERRGLVTRLASTVDRRARAIFLTPAGRTLHAALSRRVVAQNRRMIKRLRGEDAEALLRMLRHLTTPLSE